MKELRYFEHSNSLHSLKRRRKRRREWAAIVFGAIFGAWFAWAAVSIVQHAYALQQVTGR